MRAASPLMLVFLTLWLTSQTHPVFGAVFYDHVSKGFQASAINWVDANGFFLHSSNSTFALGFCDPAAIQVYLLCVVHANSQQITWTANRNSPISISDQMVFQNNGDISLSSSAGQVVWSSGTAGRGAELLQLQETGNLLVLDGSNQTLWQSFDHPTDTLLLGQKLQSGMRLTSSVSATNMSEGSYSLLLQGGALLLSANLGIPQVYWIMNSDVRTISVGSNTASYGALMSGVLGLFDNSSMPVSELVLNSAASAGGLRRAVLQPSGNLVTSFYAVSVWNEDFEAVQDSCSLPSTCGRYGICSNAGQCNCPALLSPLNSSDVAQGCIPSPQPTCSSSETDISFQSLGVGLDYFFCHFSTPLNVSSLSVCQDLCLKNCSCSALVYDQDSHNCYLLAGILGSMQSKNTANPLTFLKVLGSIQGPASAPLGAAASGGASYIVYIIPACSVAFVLIVASIFACWFYRRRKLRSLDSGAEDDGFLDSIPGLPTRFSYKQLQKATDNFSRKLGTGGFGPVYEGTLADKSKVAVKKLESVAQGKKEFRTEVATIGNIHHVHLVQLKGFCAEGTHRLLVYEFMARTSLDKSLFADHDESSSLDWSTRINIALGTARGLTYLHECCRERIIHCDIKPENILLDENFTAKVSDFGLAKLMNREQSNVFTTLRGTRGYLAPEWLMNYPISEKSDVYSFGMVLLELISGRKNFDPTEVSEKWYFPAYALRQAEEGRCNLLIDKRLKGVAEEEVTKVVQIALLCIQEEAHLRPSMGKVAQMLEGVIEVPPPPSSLQFAVGLHARMMDAISQRGRSSTSTDYNSQDLMSAIQLSGPR